MPRPPRPDAPPAPWTRDTVVRLAASARLELDATQLRLEAKGQRHAFPRSTLDLLAFFEAPRSLQEGLDHLAQQAKGPAGLAEAFARLVRLCELGVLEAPGAVPSALRPEEGSFGPPAQIRMLEDRARTSAFLEAIRRTVRPGDVVLDLGTGTGILALAAAQAGARHVYAIESQPIAEAAARLFAASPWADRITLLRGHSLDLELPEAADVLVSEIIGNDPLGENILEATADAVKRLLRPGARLIPRRLRTFLTPVEVPDALRRGLFFTPGSVARWARAYRLPLADLQQCPASQTAPRRVFQSPWSARTWKVLAPPLSLLDLDLARCAGPGPVQTVLRFARSGQFGGLILHFEALLAKDLTLSTHPSAVRRSSHWKSPLWVWPVARSVTRGTRLDLRLEVRGGMVVLGIEGADRQPQIDPLTSR